MKKRDEIIWFDLGITFPTTKHREHPGSSRLDVDHGHTLHSRAGQFVTILAHWPAAVAASQAIATSRAHLGCQNTASRAGQRTTRLNAISSEGSGKRRNLWLIRRPGRLGRWRNDDRVDAWPPELGRPTDELRRAVALSPTHGRAGLSERQSMHASELAILIVG